MKPAQPPLPTDWSLPFQPETGSQTSILMSESLEGLNVAATRQNSGSLLYGDAAAACEPLGSGGVNSPADTVCAEVMVAFGCERVVKPSQEAAAAGRSLSANIGSKSPKTIMARSLSRLESTIHLL